MSAEISSNETAPLQMKTIVKIGVITFFIGFALNFPLIKNIETFVANTVKKNPACPVSFDKMELSFFMPGVNFTGVSMPSRCMKMAGAPITMKSLKASLNGLSFAPFGPQFSVNTKVHGIPLKTYITVGFTDIVIKIDDTKVSTSQIQKFLPPTASHIKGDFTASMLTSIKSGKLSNMQFRVKSKNLYMAEKDLGFFKLPELDLGNFQIKGDLHPKNLLKIEELLVGNDKAPVKGKFQGNIQLNPRTPIMSPINLEGEVKFSPKLLAKFAFIEDALAKYRKDDGFYKLKLGGTLGLPQPL